MYYVETRADNSGYTNHRVICLVVIGSSFDSEQVFQVSNGYLNRPRRRSDDNSSTFFLRKVELIKTEKFTSLNNFYWIWAGGLVFIVRTVLSWVFIVLAH